MVHGGDLQINRAAAEDPRVDILSHPYRTRLDSGINHVLAVKAAENRVAMELNLKYFLFTRPNQRYRVLNQFRQIMKLHRQYHVPVIITSDARSPYDLRHPLDVVALAACFGMTKEEAGDALSKTPQEIMERNEIRDEVIIPGVKLVK
nr:RNase P subunit p30 family protein [Methanobacterium formicicum]